jgi:ribonuclease PH
MKRADGRKNLQLRPVAIVPDFVQLPAGSALIEIGKTKVVCTASIDERLPHWLHQQQRAEKEKIGWITAEYSILPGAGPTRTFREATAGRKTGRTLEIQRMIGRAFRALIDLKALGERTIWVDCDVIQADGGTRSAAITGGFIALVRALEDLQQQGMIVASPVKNYLAAVSVGVLDDEVVLDLDYDEDSRVAVDLNVVMEENGRLIEVQGTAEKGTFTREQLEEMLAAAEQGIEKLIRLQKESLK